MFRSLVVTVVSIACVGSIPAGSVRADDSEAKATFFRAINLNGPPLVIDGNKWEGREAKDIECDARSFDKPNVVLKPPTDRVRAQMLRSSRWSRNFSLKLTNLPAGEYQLFAYVWEDNAPTQFDIEVNGKQVVAGHNSQGAGVWSKLGPWQIPVVNGTIHLTATGGDANFSGIELWSGTGKIPEPQVSEFVEEPTSQQLTFFENRIRPLLAKHCYECHSADAKNIGGGLLLDSRPGIIKGGDTEPPVVPGQPGASLLITAVQQTDASLMMPPKSKLSSEEIADLETWIAQGAPDPRIEESTSGVRSKYVVDWTIARTFWSFQPLSISEPPAVKHPDWPITEIDRFLLARMEAAGVPPTQDADREALIRRVTFDLIGLPPTPTEIDAFLADTSDAAWAHVVDRLLATRQYGERWGRHWLDVVRYSDTAGDNSDFPIPQMYRYRNWVIDALNRDLPYNEFVTQQLAGDMLPADSTEDRHQKLIATGYLANARRFGSRVDDYPQHLTIEDTLDNLGRAFLGLTINCARCHDHKFDPISTRDYYSLYGFFHNTKYPWPGIELEQKQRDLVPLVSAAEVQSVLDQRQHRKGELENEVRLLEKKQKEIDKDDETQKKEIEAALAAARKALDTHSREALPYEQAYAVTDSGAIEEVAVQQKGDPTKPGAMVRRRFLSILGGTDLPADDPTSGRRQLAQWIVDPANPLTSRVIVNRVWAVHFGRGLVPTPNDFGKQGRTPTHPELLDWLARRFMENGWSLKRLHREILLSRAYQLSSEPNGIASERDPTNELYASFPHRRLDAEAIRDSLLYLSGRLDSTVGTAHPFPPQTEWRFTQHNPFKAVYDTNRRSVYLMTQRIQRHPYLAIFDGADPATSTPQRQTSTTPLQALYLLNDAFVHEQTNHFGDRIRQQSTENRTRVAWAFRSAFGRIPDATETEVSIQLVSAVARELEANGLSAEEVEKQSWSAFVRALLRTNEFVYVR